MSVLKPLCSNFTSQMSTWPKYDLGSLPFGATAHSTGRYEEKVYHIRTIKGPELYTKKATILNDIHACMKRANFLPAALASVPFWFG
jgi:hypothetical protein